MPRLNNFAVINKHTKKIKNLEEELERLKQRYIELDEEICTLDSYVRK